MVKLSKKKLKKEYLKAKIIGDIATMKYCLFWLRKKYGIIK